MIKRQAMTCRQKSLAMIMPVIADRSVVFIGKKAIKKAGVEPALSWG